MASISDTVKWILGLPKDEPVKNPDTGPRYQEWRVELPVTETVDQAIANRKIKETFMAKVKNLSAKRRKKNPTPVEVLKAPPVQPVANPANTIPRTLKTTIVSSKPVGK